MDSAKSLREASPTPPTGPYRGPPPHAPWVGRSPQAPPVHTGCMLMSQPVRSPGSAGRSKPKSASSRSVRCDRSRRLRADSAGPSSLPAAVPSAPAAGTQGPPGRRPLRAPSESPPPRSTITIRSDPTPPATAGSISRAMPCSRERELPHAPPRGETTNQKEAPPPPGAAPTNAGWRAPARPVTPPVLPVCRRETEGIPPGTPLPGH